MSSLVDEFKAELKTLLNKYNATICEKYDHYGTDEPGVMVWMRAEGRGYDLTETLEKEDLSADK